MKLHRLHLRDVKGVRDRTVEFPDSGVVVIEGPNEVGKTTLLEAFDLLLNPKAKATSQSQAVKALQPLGQDVGPFVEAEFSVGSHRLRFAKQWLRGASTELEILSPAREQHSGEQAQQRLDAILTESLDRPLWDALRFAQAGELGQMALTDSAVLTEALDGASGADLHSADGAPLLEQVDKEFRRYYTATGRVTGELLAARGAAVAAQDTAVQSHQRLVETQELVDRHERLRAELGELVGSEEALEARVVRAREHDSEISALVRAHDEATAALAQTRQTSVRARQDLTHRERSVQDLVAAQERLASAGEVAARQREELATLEEGTVPLVEARDAARVARDQAVEVSERAFADVEHVDARDRVAQLAMTLERVQELRSQEITAQEALDAAPDLDDATVTDLEGAERDVVQQRARLEASSGHVLMEALGRAHAVVVNGETVEIEAQSATEVSVRGGLQIELPGDLRVTVRPEDSAAKLATDLEASEARLAELLEDAGVEDLAAARAAAVARTSAAVRRRNLTERIRDLLGGEREEQLAADLELLRCSVAEHVVSRPTDYSLPESAATARGVARAATGQRRAAAAAFEGAEAALREHEARCGRLAAQVERAAGVNDEMSERLDLDRSRLQESQQATPDEALRTALSAAGAALARVEARVDVTRRELEEADVDGVRARLAETERAHQEHQSALGRVRQSLDQVQGQVELVSGEGRQEIYNLAVDQFVQLKNELDAVQRKARAARLLRETLERHRDAAHRAYVRPYQEEIRRLGREVYGASFTVEIADDLTISGRTLDGTSVPFDQLSGGAKEQLGILSRLAVAGLVESGAGVPVIIDDALGYTDPERLQRVSAVLSGPGERTQVVLLTCTPERYGQIEGATTIRLTA